MEIHQNIQNFDLQQMYYICTVAHYGTVSRAADNLFMTQPALSRYISKAEDALGEKLFYREQNEMKLTPVGVEYVKYAREILELQTKMSRCMGEVSAKVKSSVNFVMGQEYASMLLPVFLPRFEQVLPKMQFQLQQGYRRNIIKKIVNSQADFTVIETFPNESLEGIEAIHVAKEKVYLAAPVGFIPMEARLNGRPDCIDPRALFSMSPEQFPWILEGLGESMRVQADNIFAEYNYKPVVKYSVSNNETAYRLVSAGLGVSFVKAATINRVRAAGNLMIYQFGEEPLEMEICLLYRKGRQLCESDQQIIELVKGLPWGNM